MKSVKKQPQLRILATNYCACKCIYCQPSGEGNIRANEKQEIDISEVIQIAKLYIENGGTEMKITGGDPVFWTDLVECVHVLKGKLGLQKIEVITRNPNILTIIDRLVAVGLDVLNFSLDTLDKNIYKQITGCSNFEQYIAAIRICAQKGIICKINSVIMKNINDREVSSLVEFCEQNNIQQLKFLDIIDDLQDRELEKRCDLHKYFVPLDFITNSINDKVIRNEIIYQGGLGHPMNKYILSSGLEVILKNSQNGAWYGSECGTCNYYPCHDALMAIRLCPGNILQMCLLNSDKNIKYNNSNRKEKFEEMMAIFQNAFFVE